MAWGIVDDLTGAAGDVWNGVNEGLGDPVGWAGDALGSGIDTLSGQNDFKATPYNPQQGWVGGSEDAFNRLQDTGYAGMDQANAGMGKYQGTGDYFTGQAMGAQNRMGATENWNQAYNEAQSRGDMQGAIDLASQAALGNAPSEAAYMLQRGLDSATASQLSQAGSARGLGALSTAQGQAAGNIANLQQQTFGQAGQLRAQEMANARGMLGSLVGAQRGMDQARLGQGNQMSQFNQAQNDQYQQGMGQLGAQYGQLGLGYGQLGQGYYGQVGQQGMAQGQLQAQREGQAGDQYSGAQNMNAAIGASNVQGKSDFWKSALSNVAGGGTGVASGLMGSLPKP